MVGFCGSRSLPASASSLVRSVVASVAASGAGLASGCAAGADALAISAALSLGLAPRLSVFAAFGPGGVGAAGSSSAPAVVARAAAAGASVSWWAGGPASVPLRARLARRSLAFVQALAASPSPSGLVAFVSAPPPRRSFGPGPFPSCGSGSWSSVAAAALLGLSVVVFPVGWSPASGLPALPSGPGSWVPAGPGPWASGFRWQPAAVQASLF